MAAGKPVRMILLQSSRQEMVVAEETERRGLKVI